MKQIKFYMSIVAVSALLFTSCSKDDPGTEPAPGEKEMVALSFNGALQQFARKAATKQGEGTQVPLCNEDSDPAYVQVAVADSEGNWITGDFITIPVIPVSIDSGGEETNNYLTFEAEELELEEGAYSLEYFSVYNSNDELIFLAPRGDETYGPANFEEFVTDPLPINFDLAVGTKHYVEVEVLCYDEAQARQYGYLFFDFEQVPLTYLCIFGNECDETGRHFPSNFRVMIWEYPTVDGSTIEFTEENALVNVVNNVEREGDDVVYAEPVCFPLPDRSGENLFYGEIWTVDADGENIELIRRGDFSDEDTKSPEFDIDNDENLRNYWHFREGPFCGEDSSPCMLSDVVENSVQDFETGELLAGTVTKYIDVDTNNDGIYDDADADQGTAPYGGYLITDDASNYYNKFTSESYDGNMIVFDGSPNSNNKVYYTIETPTLCEGDIYYLKMDLRDISSPDANNANLIVNYQTSTTDKHTAARFMIDPLADNNSGIANWKTVGIKVTASEDGQMLIIIRDTEENNSGNDFAMDNIVLSNDPTILNGIPAGNINPNN